MGLGTPLLALAASAALSASLMGTAYAVTPSPEPRAALGATVTADFSVTPTRYTPGRPLTVAVTGTLTTTAQRDVVCHSLDTRVLVGRIELDGSLDATDRKRLSAGETHSEQVSVDVDAYAPDRGNLTVQVTLQCSPVDASGNWSFAESKSAVIWTSRIAPVAGSLTVSPARVFPDAEDFDSRARITASAARGPITITVTYDGRQVWSATSRSSRISVTVPDARLARSGTYTAAVTGDPGSRATFVVSRGWAPLYDAQVASWPRCSTITWRYDGADAPSGGDRGMVDDLRATFARYAELTGLRFVEGGSGIVVSWADLPRGTNAEAGAGLVSDTLSDGFLRLSRNAERPRVPGFGTSGRGVTLLHEMGHVLGLGHVKDRAQLMYPVHSAGSPLTPQRGDIAGLKDLYAPSTCR